MKDSIDEDNVFASGPTRRTSGDIATGQPFTSGWGEPVNAVVGAKTHWYNSDDEAICGKEHMRYAGERLPSGMIRITRACPDCLNMVVKVFGDLANIVVAR